MVPPFAGLLHAGWQFAPSVVLGTLGIAAAYLAATGLLRGPRRFPTGKALLFLAGLFVFFLTLASPLDVLADEYLFSAHMLQHLLMVLVAAPLLLAGIPSWLLPRLDPDSSGYTLARWLNSAPVAFVLFNLVFALSHAPRLYDAVLRSERLHITEHLLFVALAMLNWWPLLSPSEQFPRLSHPLRLLYAFAETIPMFVVGALVTMSDTVLYRFYSQPTHLLRLRLLLGWDVPPLSDQRLGGLMMWLGGSFFYLGVLTAIWFIWAGQEEERQDGPAYANGARARG